MSPSSEDEIFSSLEGSLMNELLSDIGANNTVGNNSPTGEIFNLAALEKELDRCEEVVPLSSKSITATTQPSVVRGGPPGLLSTPSAGAIIVGHTSLRQLQNPNSSALPIAATNSLVKPLDAWAASLEKFAASELSEDFLKADNARKEQQKLKTDNPVIFDEYEVHGEITLTKEGNRNIYPGNSISEKKVDDRVTEKSTSPVSSHVSNYNVPSLHMQKPLQRPNIVNGQHVMESQQQGLKQTQQRLSMMGAPPHHGLMQSHMMMPPPPHIIGQSTVHMNVMGVPPQHHVNMMRAPPSQHPMTPNPQGYFPNPIPNPNPNHNQMLPPMRRENETPSSPMPKRGEEEKNGDIALNASNFPDLGCKAKEPNDDKKNKLEKSSKKKSDVVENHQNQNIKSDTKKLRVTTPQASSQILRKSRLSFFDPSPHAPPIHATSIPSSSMTARDLCYVLHSMMRPILTFSSVLDAYNADYYRWSHEDRKSRNLRFLGGMGNNIRNLPKPVWKETKVKARKMEEMFIESVEKRASDWSKDEGVLGKIVKTNVKKPRALLATSVLSLSRKGGKAMSQDQYSEKDQQRANLWKARAVIDQGCLAFLNLIELRRLLQSHQGGNVTESGVKEGKLKDLLEDVEENVSKLQVAFGVSNFSTKENSIIKDIEINYDNFCRALSLPKGCVLLSRVIDEGIFPHPSACHVLPSYIRFILQKSLSKPDCTSLPLAENRLLMSFLGLIRTVQPSLHPRNVLDCLSVAIDAGRREDMKEGKMKIILEGNRTLMEILHAILSRGNEICPYESGFGKEWKTREAEFMSLLSQR